MLLAKWVKIAIASAIPGLLIFDFGHFLIHPVLEWRLLCAPSAGTKAAKEGFGRAPTSPFMPIIGWFGEFISEFGDILAHREHKADSARRSAPSRTVAVGAFATRVDLDLDPMIRLFEGNFLGSLNDVAQETRNSH